MSPNACDRTFTGSGGVSFPSLFSLVDVGGRSRDHLRGLPGRDPESLHPVGPEWRLELLGPQGYLLLWCSPSCCVSIRFLVAFLTMALKVSHKPLNDH